MTRRKEEGPVLAACGTLCSGSRAVGVGSSSSAGQLHHTWPVSQSLGKCIMQLPPSVGVCWQRRICTCQELPAPDRRSYTSVGYWSSVMHVLYQRIHGYIYMSSSHKTKKSHMQYLPAPHPLSVCNKYQ